MFLSPWTGELHRPSGNSFPDAVSRLSISLRQGKPVHEIFVGIKKWSEKWEEKLLRVACWVIANWFFKRCVLAENCFWKSIENRSPTSLPKSRSNSNDGFGITDKSSLLFSGGTPPCGRKAHLRAHARVWRNPRHTRLPAMAEIFWPFLPGDRAGVG